MRKELKTAQDLYEFLRKLDVRMKRLESDGGGQKKLAILQAIYNNFHHHFLTYTNIRPNEYASHIGDYEYRAHAQIPENVVRDLCKNIETYYQEQGGAKYINDTLGTHRNWFKWLLNFLFSVPKSKQLIDEYGLFKQSDTIKNTEGNLDVKSTSVKKV